MIAAMGATTTYGWPLPELIDPANGPAGFQGLGQAVEDTVKDTALTTYVPAWTSGGAAQPGGTVTKAGHYRLDHGRCLIRISLLGGASPSGGTGPLYLSLPIAPRADMTFQVLPCWFYSPASGGGIYHGVGRPLAGQTAMPIYLPASATDTRLSQWRNAADGNASGTGIPLVAGTWSMTNGTEVVVQGSYFV